MHGPLVAPEYRPSVTIATESPSPMPIRIAVYDALGRHVRRLVDAVQPAGEHGVVWDGRSDRGELVARGTYLVELVGGDERMTQKLLLR